MYGENTVYFKIEEIKRELQLLGLWKNTLPDWVINFSESLHPEKDFEGWIQFILFPNLQQAEIFFNNSQKKLLVLQALNFYGNDLKKGRLLHLLIELDSLL